MNSGILNIWREVGAYLRYGDAKSVLLLSLASGLFYWLSQVQFGVTVFNVSALALSFWATGFSTSTAALSLFGTAVLIGVLGFLPALTKKSIRVHFWVWLGFKFSLISVRETDANCVFFVDIASFSDADAYTVTLLNNLELTNPCQADREAIRQIWIVSRIGTAKFVQIAMVSYLLFAGIVLVLVGG